MRAVIGLFIWGLAAAGAAQGAESLDWLAGNWVEAKGGNLSEEAWFTPRGGMLIGLSRSGKAGERGMFEFMRIEAGLDGRLSFVAQPNGAAPSAFQMVEQSSQSIRFESAAHDYPQRIRYWREGEHLMAEISLLDGTKAHRWRYERRR